MCASAEVCGTKTMGYPSGVLSTAAVAGSRARWPVALLAGMSAFLQGAMCNFYSPISDKMTQAYGWDDDHFAWLLNASNIVFVVVCPAWPWFIQRRGLRAAMLLTYSCLLVSAALRCIPRSCGNHYWYALSSMLFNGLAAPCCSLMPPAVSWATPILALSWATELSPSCLSECFSRTSTYRRYLPCGSLSVKGPPLRP